MPAFEMSAMEALKLARKKLLVSRNEERRLSEWLKDPRPNELPPHLKQAAQWVYLLRTKPPTQSVH